MTLRHMPRQPLASHPDGPASRDIIPDPPSGWETIAVSEWELRQAEWRGQHPFEETNYVLEGTLHVECDGHTVIATAGDTVTVPANRPGRYWAPQYARMLAVYSPNPAGLPSALLGYRRLPAAGSTAGPAAASAGDPAPGIAAATAAGGTADPAAGGTADRAAGSAG